MSAALPPVRLARATTLLLALLTAGGCRDTAPCAPDTLFLTVALGPEAQQATRLAVRVIDGGERVLASGEVDRPGGQSRGSIEVRFGRYPADQAVRVEVDARRADALVAHRSLAARLAAGCTALTIDLTASDGGSGTPDGAPPDRPADQSPPDAPSDARPDASADGPDDAPAPDAGSDGLADRAPDLPPDGPPSALKIVFVTSTRYTGNLGGLSGAHAICQQVAGGAGLSGSYRAWLSQNIPQLPEGPASAMVHSSVPYVLVGGQQVADNWDDLTDGSLDRRIDQDERGNALLPAPQDCLGDEVWSSTSAAGSPRLGGDCFGWRSTTGSANVGSSWHSDGRWSEGCGNPRTCQTDLPLFCLEQ